MPRRMAACSAPSPQAPATSNTVLGPRQGERIEVGDEQPGVRERGGRVPHDLLQRRRGERQDNQVEALIDDAAGLRERVLAGTDDEHAWAKADAGRGVDEAIVHIAPEPGPDWSRQPTPPARYAGLRAPRRGQGKSASRRLRRCPRRLPDERPVPSNDGLLRLPRCAPFGLAINSGCPHLGLTK